MPVHIDEDLMVSDEEITEEIPSKPKAVDLRRPPMLDMILDAILMASEPRKGASFKTIKVMLTQKYELNLQRMIKAVRRAIIKGVDKGLIYQPRKDGDIRKGGEVVFNGRFKLDKANMEARNKKDLAKAKAKSSLSKARKSLSHTPLATKSKEKTAKVTKAKTAGEKAKKVALARKGQALTPTPKKKTPKKTLKPKTTKRPAVSNNTTPQKSPAAKKPKKAVDKKLKKVSIEEQLAKTPVKKTTRPKKDKQAASRKPKPTTKISKT